MVQFDWQPRVYIVQRYARDKPFVIDLIIFKTTIQYNMIQYDTRSTR
jgi:hypothetical protein